jgi:DnaJ homologue, subfamily C, member 28, conserved domain
MTDQKKPVNWTSLAEKRIREAEAAGEFENLPGFGQPIPGIDEPYDENWWVKEKLRRERISALPPALEIARDKERSLAAIAKLTSEAEVRRELVALNERIRRAHFSCTWGPSCNTVPMEIEPFVQDWKSRGRNRR